MRLASRLIALSDVETWSGRRIAWAGGLFIVATAAFAAYDIALSHHQAVADTRRELDSQSRAIAEQTARTVQAVDVMLRHIAGEYKRGRISRLGTDDLHAYLRDMATGMNQIDGLGMFDAGGDQIGVSWPSPRRAVNMAALPRFQQLRDDPAPGFVVFGAAPAAGEGHWIVPFGRRLEHEDGGFAGVVAARGGVDYFERFYRDAYPDPSTRVALLHRDTTLLARHPSHAGSLGQQYPALESLLPGADGQPRALRGPSPVDGVDRFAAIRLVPDYPLVVVVSRDAAAALAPWRAQAIGSTMRTLALAALAAVLMVLLWRQIVWLSAARGSLVRSEERYALAAAGSDTGIWDWDLVAGTAYESRRAREILGLPLEPETQALDDIRRLIVCHPDDMQRRADALQAHLDGHRPHYEVEYRVRRADGRTTWIHVRALCVRDAAGRPQRIAGSVSDIDDRKRAEEALRQSEERYALAMTGSRGGHWVWNVTTGELFISPKVHALLGLPAQTAPASHAEFLQRLGAHPEDLDRTLRAGRDPGSQPQADFEARVMLPDGTTRWILTRAQLFGGVDGKDERIAGVTVDITERKQAEEQRDRLQQQLRQAQKLEAIGTLAGGIAHDFNNILSAILGYGEMAQKAASEGSAQRRHLDAALAAGQRAKSLVERILAFSRSGIGERVPVHVRAIVTEALDTIAATLPAGVRLERRIGAQDAAVLGDATQIHQVAMNLCANAVQAMRSEGTLVVVLDDVSLPAALAVATSTLAPGRYVRLSVADTGSGIEPRLLERIFDPFFTTKEVGVGTGLGLSLVHGIVTDLGGGIDVESRLGAGSTFTVYLPSTRLVAAPATDVIDAAIVRGDGQTVLLIDDEEPLMRLCEELLAGLGYEPVGFVSSREALETLRTEPDRFDLVLTDESMPGLGGCEFAVEVRTLRTDLPILLMTGLVSPSLVQQARAAGVAEVLGKPLALPDLARALAAALQAESARRQEAPTSFS